MAIPMFLEDMSILSKLGDKPGEYDGLSTPQFKAKFDEGTQKIQNYINETLVPAIENTAPGLYSVTMDMAYCFLERTGWFDNAQTVPVTNAIADSAKQAVIVASAPDSLETYLDCNIRLVSQNEGSLTFACDDAPEFNVAVNILLLTKGG
jgi:hypothetical protein